MKPFLFLDNWGRAQPKNLLETALDAAAWPVKRIEAARDALPSTVDFCGAFVGPSDAAAYDETPWVRAEQRYLRDLAASGVPILGLCFGAQTLAWALFGEGSVRRRAERESGYGRVTLTADGRRDMLTQELPPVMDVFHWHGDEVVAAHPDMVVLAQSEACANQIWRWRRGPVWGVQPHPEYDAAGMRAWFEGDRERFAANGYDAANAAQPACSEAPRIFERFLAIVQAGTASLDAFSARL
jgi:GMP synthase (glutamine-hydrolysing)